MKFIFILFIIVMTSFVIAVFPTEVQIDIGDNQIQITNNISNISNVSNVISDDVEDKSYIKTIIFIIIILVVVGFAIKYYINNYYNG